MYIHPTIEEFLATEADCLTPWRQNCLLSQHPKDWRGRGRYTYYITKGNRVSVDAQRYMHFLFTRRHLNSKEQVISTCRAELCCNPFHLGIAKRTRMQSLEEAAAACARRQAPLAPLNPHRHLNKRQKKQTP